MDGNCGKIEVIPLSDTLRYGDSKVWIMTARVRDNWSWLRNDRISPRCVESIQPHSAHSALSCPLAFEYTKTILVFTVALFKRATSRS